MDWTGVAKHTFTIGTSSFDVGSDIANAMTFMGYFNPTKNNDTRNASNVSSCLNNQSFWENITDNSLNDISGRERVDKIWGNIGLALLFIPGIIAFLPAVIGSIYYKEWRDAIMFGILSLTFPIAFIVAQLVVLGLTCCKSNCSNNPIKSKKIFSRNIFYR